MMWTLFQVEMKPTVAKTWLPVGHEFRDLDDARDLKRRHGRTPDDHIEYRIVRVTRKVIQ